jgi:hypothetical protein
MTEQTITTIDADMKDMIIPVRTTALEVFKAGGSETILTAIHDEVAKFVADVTTVRGRGEIASIAHKVARSKTFLDNAGKALVADLKNQVGVVDAERKRIRDDLDALKAQVRQPLDQWEEDEARRIEGLKARLGNLQVDPALLVGQTALSLAATLRTVKSIPIDDSWQEFAAAAGKAKDHSVTMLESALERQTKYEIEQMELERLRQEEQERKAREEQERLAREEQERKAREDAEKEKRRVAEEAARQKAVEQAREEERRWAKEVEEKQAREIERLHQQAVVKEKERKLEEEWQKTDLEERIRREKEQAAQRERQAIEREIRERQAKEEKIARKKKVRAAVRKLALAALSLELETQLDGDVPAGLAEAIFNMIDEGKVPHISVTYQEQ